MLEAPSRGALKIDRFLPFLFATYVEYGICPAQPPGETILITFMKKIVFILLFSLFIASCEKYDDAALWKAIDENTAKIQALQTQVDNLNRRAEELKSLIDAVDKKESVKTISELDDGTGYAILFTSGRSIVIHHGNDGSSPLISVMQDADGIWYWAINGNWLLNETGEKIAASAKNGEDGITPQVIIEDGYWYVSTNGGQTWTKLSKATGEDGKDGDAFFKEVRQDDENAYFELVDGIIITLPLASALKFNIVLDSDTVPIIDAGESKTIRYSITKATDQTIVKAIAQNGWSATVNQKSKESGEIIVQAPNPIVASEILVFASDGEGHTVMAVLDCVKGQCAVAKNSYSVDSDGGNIDLVVTTNMPYNIAIPTEAQSWISLKPETKATVTEIKTLIIGKNTDYQKRFATIKVIDDEDNALHSIEILQDAAEFNGELSITVTSPGTLASALSSYSYASIKSISICGPLNETDYSFIKDELNALRTLNLSGATGVEPNFKNDAHFFDLIILPSSQTSISDEAFTDSNIIRIILPENLQRIGSRAFYNCTKMTGATFIPKSVTSIGAGAFAETQIEDFTFADGIQLTQFEEASLPPNITSLRIPASVVSVRYSDFSNLKSLKRLTFEDGSIITAIPSFCFAGLPLNNVVLPKSLIRIGGKTTANAERSSTTRGNYMGGAFESCTMLTNIVIPKNVEEIEPGAFYSSGLKNLFFEEGSKLEIMSGWTAQYNSYVYRVGAFSSTQLETITIPENVTEIQDAAFANCIQLKTIDFSGATSLITIGGCYDDPTLNSIVRGAFYSCTGLQSLLIPPSVEVIQAGAFAWCTGLSVIQFAPNSHLTKISGAYYRHSRENYRNVTGAFSNCKNLTSIIIPKSVQVIEAGAFYECSSLSDLVFEEGSCCEQIMGLDNYYNDTVEYGPFTYTSIQTLTLPSSMKTLFSCSLAKMTHLTSIIISDGANVAFRTGALRGSNELSLIDASKASFTASVGAFAPCPISIVKIGDINPPACANAFGNNLSNATLYVPAESIEYYKLEEPWKSFGTILSL